MDNYENNENILGKFTKKFIINYIVSVILIGIVSEVLVAVFSMFLPEKIISVINFILSAVVLWKVGVTSIDMSLLEAKIDSNNIKAVLKRIYIFFLVLIVINVGLTIFLNTVAYKLKQIDFSAVLINIVITGVANTIRYIALMLVCKNRLNQKVLGESSHNMLYLVILLIGLIVFSCGVFLVPDSEKILDAENATIAEKYKDESWEKIVPMYSSGEKSGEINVDVSIGHFEKGVTKEYKVVKIICTIYDKNNGKFLGVKEKYYENVELEDNYMAFRDKFRIKSNNRFIGSDYELKVEAYGVRK